MVGRTDNSRITKVLGTLVALLDGPKTHGQLMDATGIAHTTMWAHLDALVKMGLVREVDRLPGPHGGRTIPLYGATVQRIN